MSALKECLKSLLKHNISIHHSIQDLEDLALDSDFRVEVRNTGMVTKLAVLLLATLRLNLCWPCVTYISKNWIFCDHHGNISSSDLTCPRH